MIKEGLPIIVFGLILLSVIMWSDFKTNDRFKEKACACWECYKANWTLKLVNLDCCAYPCEDVKYMVCDDWNEWKEYGIKGGCG